MKERPISFGGWSIPKLMDDTKTQTRRVARMPLGVQSDWNIQPTRTGAGLYVTNKDNIVFNTPCGRPSKAMQDHILRCPYGVPGDVLWVKETFAHREDIDGTLWPARARHYCHYKADNTGWRPNDGMNWHLFTPWKSARYMPRWASRISLELTGVRVERVQDISREDAIAEGAYALENRFVDAAIRHAAREGRQEVGPIDYFARLWDSINANPKRAKRNPYTLAKEDCYVSYPWRDVQETRQKNGLPWYVVGNAWVWANELKRITDGADSL